jgi:adenosylmethionine-8-amino-7-oxononanoate aminotransferase
MNAREYLAMDRRHIWHPYTQMKDYAERDPLLIESASGIKVFDAQGNAYYDTIASWWCNVHGHCHPRLTAALARQAERLEHIHFAGCTHPPAIDLVSELQPLLPSELSRFFFSDNGSTANEIALKLAFQYWKNRGRAGKTEFAYLENAYHGDTVGAMSVGGMPIYHELFAPLRFHAHPVPAPACCRCPHRQTEFTGTAEHNGCQLECFAPMRQTLEQHHHRLAAVIVEPLMQGSAGISFYPPAYLQALRSLTRELDLLLIFDEVATGFGRTGKMFAFEHAQVVPDFLTLSKGLTAGYMAMSLTITTEPVYNAFYDDDYARKTFFHGHTYTANPLTCAVAAESLRMLKEANLPESATPQSEHFQECVTSLTELDCIADIRYRGLIGAVDLTASRRAGRSLPADQRAGNEVYWEGLRHHLLLRPLGNTIYWILPFAAQIGDITEIMRLSRLTLETWATRARAKVLA